MSELGTEDRQASRLEESFVASSWTLMARKFKKHKLAIAGAIILCVLYLVGAIAPDFFSTSHAFKRYGDFTFAPPQRIRLLHHGQLRRPFVYGYRLEVHPETLRNYFLDDEETIYPIRFFIRAEQYKLLGLFKTRVRFMGVEEPGTLFLFGTDNLARDVYSRTLIAARISLTVGLVGVAMSFVLGCLLGGISGFFGGTPDMVIQRIVEFLISLPSIPLWMALAAAVPPEWPAVRTYFMITIILSIVGWTGLARVVRGKLLQLRAEDYVIAAKIAGMREAGIIGKTSAAGLHELSHRAPDAGNSWYDSRRDGVEFYRCRSAAAGVELGGAAAAGAERQDGGAEPVAAHAGGSGSDYRPVFQLRRGWVARRRGPLQTVAAGAVRGPRSLRVRNDAP